MPILPLFKMQAMKHYPKETLSIKNLEARDLQENDGTVLIPFDLNFPIDHQISQAKNTLNNLNKGKGRKIRNRRLHYPQYLRALDGETNGALPKEIAAILYPSYSNEYPDYIATRSVRDTLKAAKTLRDETYKFIPAMNPKK